MIKTCKISRSTDSMFRLGMDFTTFEINLDTKLPKGTRLIINGIYIITSETHDVVSKIDGSWTNHIHFCKLLTNDAVKFIDAKDLFRGASVTYFTEDEIPDSITHTRKMSVEDIIKDYGDHFTKEQIENLADMYLKGFRSVEKDRKAFAEGILFGYREGNINLESNVYPREIGHPVPVSECFKVVRQPWGNYTLRGDSGFFIPRDRKSYSWYQTHKEMQKSQIAYNIAQNLIENEIEKELTTNPFPIDEIKARIEELENKAVYQVRDRDAFYKCKKLDIFMTGHKGFIAGGCFKNIFTDQKIKDVDIFFERIEDWNEALNYYKSQTQDFSFVYENDNATGFKHIKSNQKLEIIKSRFGKPEELIRNFDFTIAKFAYYKDTSNDDVEYKFIYHPDFFEHLTLKKLVMDESSLFPVNTFERSYKYQRYGFGMCRETKQKLLKLLQGANVDDIGSSLYFGFD